MKPIHCLVAFALPALALSLDAAPIAREFTFSADKVAVDNVTRAAVATGHVKAVSAPLSLCTDYAERTTNGVMRLRDPTRLTTCTNEPGICHWSLDGEVEYVNGKYIEGRNIWVHFYEVPVLWVPYFYYPLDDGYSLRFMPGYTEQWGAYLMTKTTYDIIGDPEHRAENLWLHGDTRFDVRYINGVAVGQTLKWGLGRAGTGYFKVYYAWDENYDEYDNDWYSSRRRYCNWGSPVNRDRYRLELEHRLDLTERDIVRVSGSLVSDSYFDGDFFRNDFWTIENVWNVENRNEIAWEHNENILGTGLSVSGPLNGFYGGTSRLPELYLDLAPMPVFDTFLVYESENRIGYLRRSAAEYGDSDALNPYCFNPGRWAGYESFRFDTYHRLTAPFRAADLVSVVPRIGLRGTFWNESGETNVDGWDYARNAGGTFRSIFESGVTFAGRGRAWLSNAWRHTIEPYADVLAQQAWYDGVSGGARPYVFDNLDASLDWSDQFAGRSRLLPYGYYGVTPGLRNAFDKTDENGRLRTLFDIDIFAALQFNHASWYGRDDMHKLAKPGDPNYGKSDIYCTPGLRARWFPDEDISLMAQLEYDPDYNNIPLAELEWKQVLTRDWSYFVRYNGRNYRRWDFSSTPYEPSTMTEDILNTVRYDYLQAGFTQQPISWFAWSPFVSWDCRVGELDRVGSWFDYLTDCLGFRLILEYRNKFTRIDGSERREDTHVGFFIYLRALGADASNVFD